MNDIVPLGTTLGDFAVMAVHSRGGKRHYLLKLRGSVRGIAPKYALKWLTERQLRMRLKKQNGAIKLIGG